SLKIHGRETKYILKEAFSEKLPDTVLRRKKMGFGVPLCAWFRGPLRDWVRDSLLAPSFLSAGYFQATRLQTLVDEHVRGDADHASKLWTLLALQSWYETFIRSAKVGMSVPAREPAVAV
ncbi:MAG: asparagine synthase-related protein, partial [Phycisphaerae bacterium]